MSEHHSKNIFYVNTRCFTDGQPCPECDIRKDPFGEREGLKNWYIDEFEKVRAIRAAALVAQRSKELQRMKELEEKELDEELQRMKELDEEIEEPPVYVTANAYQ